MKLSPYLQELLAGQCHHPLCTSSDCEFLVLDIESKTGEHIGLNTMKRLLGFIDDEREPRQTTLDVIASYLGYDSWETLKVFDDRSNSSFETSGNEVRTTDLHAGQRIEVKYLPDRRYVLQYMGDRHFLVQTSENSKLQVGDTLTVTHFVEGYPLLIESVVRDGQSLGAFTAGKVQGIRFRLM